jgi:ketosteroid isomerase-like protein
MAVDDEVRQASNQFYGALNQMLATGDAGAVTAVWSQGQQGSTMHPIGGREVGREQILAMWQQAGPAFSEGRATVEDLVVVALSEDVAYTIGTERFEGKLGGEPLHGEWRATNIYRREDGGWKILHHHTDASPELQAMLRRLQTQAAQTTG